MQQTQFQPYQSQNKGTLLPGQTISVNKYAVQVERYLSQGGFSHVYLVRTATPVYNTTHHVLKRIAVPNEAMLTEVKKEVDIMRILKGHPNVVHLIDAAWHRMSNGQYEVFILMEFCPGGGIIDMMNRRLRERLTEAEILQIFIDILEGVAAMHNLRPALLHRDLKVENILQSSSTSFKLCDFGSATPVSPRPPSTTQEIRALEADLNRHTTLQYRPPEMVDPYLRRPIDEKSDVWALGVLLYKLCYYTTPFEEHGPLAILNVQYRIPPYPVYSAQLNAMIASMLREHGTQRPSVFELLAQVHRMRGTKSRFTYNIAPPQPLSPRTTQSDFTNSLDDLVSYRPLPSAAAQQPSQASAGVQVREKVLDAIAPMRRGRPSSSQQHDSTPSTTSRPPSPAKGPQPAKPTKPDFLDDHFGVEEDEAWKAMGSSVSSAGGVKAYRSGGATTSTWRPKNAGPGGLDAAWSAESLSSKVTDGDAQSPSTAFGDNFAENLWSAYDGIKTGPAVAPTTPTEKVTPSKIAPPPEGSRTTKLVVTKGKDAFDGLGLAPFAAPATTTLGEARKLRTGLAAVNAYSRVAVTPNPSLAAAKPSSSGVTLTPSPRPSLPYTSSSWRFSPAVQPVSSSTSNPPVLPQLGDIYAETRFPSLEELDATFSSSQNSPRYTPQLESSLGKDKIIDLSVPSTSSLPLPPTLQRPIAGSSVAPSGVRSEQITGVAMRDTKEEPSKYLVGLVNGEGTSLPKRPGHRPASRPSLSRKHTSNASFKPSQSQESQDLLGMTGDANSISLAPQKIREPKDWLTGDVDSLTSPVKGHGFSDTNPPETPVLREFTHKRSSFIEENNVHIQSPQEAITGLQSAQQVVQEPTPPSPMKKPVRGSRSKERKRSTSTMTSDHSKNRFTSGLLSRGADLPHTSAAGFITRPSVGRSSSSDNWKVSPTLESPREAKMSSSDEESPEDVGGYMASRSAEKGSTRRHKGRQSSVHDLVDLWGGGVVQTKERRKDSMSSINSAGDFGAKPHRSRSMAVPSAMKPRANSPQRIQLASSGTIEVPRSPSRSPNRRSPNSHMRQMSAATPASAVPLPVSRGRPQSLLVFPMSKSVSDGKLDTPTTPSALAVPEDGSRKHGSRRTSITDMVQRYEAIGKISGAIPPTLPKPAGKVATPGASSTTTGRSFLRPLNSPVAPKFTSPRITPTFEDPASGVDTDNRQSPTVPRSSFTGQVDKTADLLRSQSSLTGLPTGSPSKLLSTSTSTLQGRFDGLRSLPMASATKATVPLEEDLRTPSPEKPYQGVGKLIDQWQRKSEDVASVPRRGGFAPKRAGLVAGSVSRNS